VLANRSSRLAPRQLQPYHPEDNPYGLTTWNMRAPVHYVWGMNDQMMPPAQIFRGQYLWPRDIPVTVSKIADADHFAEIDQPDEVAEDMLLAINGQLGRGTTRPLLGLNPQNTYKGDEPEIAAALHSIYGTP